MMRMFNRLALVGLAASLALTAAGAALAQAKRGPDYATYVNAKHGFSVTYPVTEFTPLPMATPDGFQAVTKDGKARLLAGTIANLDGKSLKEYRTFLINASYPGARIDYAPVRDTWFVVSGTKADGTTSFYQRVNFICGGRSINSWAVVFPYDEEYVYSNVIEQLHKDYRLGDGNCRQMSMLHPN
ncbi:MAG TPA: hypothetical protein VFY92_06730 [Hyphomicrobiaceae bacterium]|nr:hypothetical protein [Hyphomicrobiaceae bacterium]